MNAKEVRDEIIKQIIKPLFKENHFKINGTTFLKEEEGFIKVFNIQSSQWNYEECVRFTFNIGLFFNKSFPFTRSYPFPKNIKEPNCQFRMRVSTFLRKEIDEWYEIKEDLDINDLKIEIYQDVTKILNFFNKLNALEDIIGLPEIFNFGGFNNFTNADLGISLLLSGKTELGEKIINTFFLKETDKQFWKETFSKVGYDVE